MASTTPEISIITYLRKWRLPLAILAVLVVVFAFGDLWQILAGLTDEFEEPHERFFLLLPLGILFAAFLSARKSGVKKLSTSILLMGVLMAAVVLSVVAFESQNSHDFATGRFETRNLEKLASESPQWRARTTYTTFLSLRDTFEDHLVVVPRLTQVDIYNLFQRIEGETIQSISDFDPFIDYVDANELLALIESFTEAEVRVDENYDWRDVPDSVWEIDEEYRGPIGMAGGLVKVFGSAPTFRAYVANGDLVFVGES